MAGELHLLHADAVLARDRSAGLDTVLENVVAGTLRTRKLVGFASVEQNNRMEIAVSSMKDIADRQTVTLGHFMYETERGRDLGAGHDAVLNIVSGTDAPDGAKGVLTAFPK